ncbi:unnamed protein product [Adineta steineri]|uniref:GH16 domain-containing protein n=1 Tax=Adineta steineri TaxID=433720 RepID=A0A814GGT4_9BILA|nr:unnamed protein product [Adineta steineri]
MRIIYTIITTLCLSMIPLSTAQKTIQWSGYEWFLKEMQGAGPGPNDWESNNVWVDADNKLHLKLHKSPTTGGWTCAELYSKVRFSFGTFRWFVEGAIDKLDTNVVLGLFTYGGIDGTNEIDIEMAKWGRTESEASNLFYTTYPHTLDVAKPVSSGTRISLQVNMDFLNSLHENIFYSYTTPMAFTSAMPHISAPLHMNLWAFQGKPPTDSQEVEIVIHDFKYIQA